MTTFNHQDISNFLANNARILGVVADIRHTINDHTEFQSYELETKAHYMKALCQFIVKDVRNWPAVESDQEAPAALAIADAFEDSCGVVPGTGGNSLTDAKTPQDYAREWLEADARMNDLLWQAYTEKDRLAARDEEQEAVPGAEEEDEEAA